MLVFFCNDTATTEIYTLSLHDALPIFPPSQRRSCAAPRSRRCRAPPGATARSRGRRARPGGRPRRRRRTRGGRSEEHTSELQSRQYLVCRLLLEKKKKG